MTETEERVLLAGVLQICTKWVQNGGDLRRKLGEVLQAADGDVIPGADPLPIAVPLRRSDDVARRQTALEVVRRDGKISSGQLAMLCYCSDETARTSLQALARRGALRRVGERRGTCYIPGHAFPQVG